ncbi:MAG: 23S rRNA (guanosine(2251)-2'-O)-methyltransferase RlmB [Alphaproteobacteria bacterium]|nr:23S rRNA (guanosine(2251)-2'-O)-methyltransferase RlmB [Alphaproteobacteria bacterium]MBU1514711.1 23S rRNA (guanosine(2251)-2'-O)-methyltransferase RlmB [Alphaproteobacteria bacterium]MBU2093842.1 23S rRNA (guanosine(2251)-2'-O)-methyltransferase RlmB [Alphaproteobacteria bacterium]MBU2150921.1 23S rRNA (guanosine(2251)-2'-O)-methyltransferase RlmB [Alphaproteobacteria bacterium]MBU2309697.1 23S rRNA (guanosine(2251)-2'-O)-methyltransferase RlmB [Alphaproteobacteria bacterium]
MASPTERNDARKGRNFHPKGGSRGRSDRRPATVSDDWIWGWHAVEAALANPERGKPQQLLVTADKAKQVEARFGRTITFEIAEAHKIGLGLPQGAVHQGIALRPAPLEDADLDDFEQRPGAIVLVLDQVTDPQNVGAILRSAAAFGVVGLVLQDRNAPKLSGALAKAAAGAVEQVPVARVVNLSRAIDELSKAGWRTVGLEGEADRGLHEVLDGTPTVLVLGSEGEGLRRLVAEHCDELAKIAMPGGFESLNVSAAAAVALYEASRPRK